METAELPKLYTVEQAAELLGMSETLLKRLIKTGEIGRVRRNSWVRLTPAHLAEWVEHSSGRDGKENGNGSHQF